MELHPFLEHGVLPRPGVWYVVAAESGEPPSMRVGHTAVALTPSQTNAVNEHASSTVYFIGGANPDGAFAELHSLSLDTFDWDVHSLEELVQPARYEHAAWSPAPGHLAMFGGAALHGNLADLHLLQLHDKSSATDGAAMPPPSSVAIRQEPSLAPSARTQHSSAFCPLTGALYVFGGGHAGTQPIQDRRLHQMHLNVTDGVARWTKIEVGGTPPTARHGHVMACTTAGQLLVHGGMQGTTFYDDLHRVELQHDTPRWQQVQLSRRQVRPCARSAHGGVVCGRRLYVFGGMDGHGRALQDLFHFDTESNQWTEVSLMGAPPTPRLDFACCVARLHRRQPAISSDALTENNLSSDATHNQDIDPTSDDEQQHQHKTESREFDQQQPSEESNCNKTDIAGATTEERLVDVDVPVLIIHGGMDTEGLIFDDTVLILLEED